MSSNCYEFLGIPTFLGILFARVRRLYIRNSDNLVRNQHNSNITSTKHLVSLPLWQNSLVRIRNKPVYYKSSSSKGIQNVRHLVKNAHNFLSFTELKECFDVKIMLQDNRLGDGLQITFLRH